MYLRNIDGAPGFILDSDHIKTDIEIADADYEQYFAAERQGKVFRMRESPDTQSGLFGHIEEYVPDPISTQPSEIQLLQLAQAEAVEKQEADNLASQLALAEYIESQAQGGE